MKPAYKFLALFTIAMALLLAYAFVPKQWAQAVHLKQISLREVEQMGEEAEYKQDSIKAANEIKEPVDTAKQRILIFGDSMVGCICYRLGQYAKANGHQLTSVSWHSSTTELWAKTDTLQRYLKRVRPTHIFVCLGSNEIFNRDLNTREKYVQQILKKVGNTPTIWIGPPNWAKDEGFNDMLKKAMGPRAYFPSMNLTLERRSDGRHPTLKGGRIWMDKVVKWMNDGLSIHPIVLNTPPDNISNAHRIYIISPSGNKHAKDTLTTHASKELPTNNAPVVETTHNTDNENNDTLNTSSH